MMSIIKELAEGPGTKRSQTHAIDLRGIELINQMISFRHKPKFNNKLTTCQMQH